MTVLLVCRRGLWSSLTVRIVAVSDLGGAASIFTSSVNLDLCDRQGLLGARPKEETGLNQMERRSIEELDVLENPDKGLQSLFLNVPNRMARFRLVYLLYRLIGCRELRKRKGRTPCPEDVGY